MLLGAMVLCLVVALRWRLSATGGAIPILLLPRPRVFLKILGYGVLLPLAIYAMVAIAVPISGHAYSVKAGWHKLVAEILLLVTALLLLPAWLTMVQAHRRCRELGIPVPNGSLFLGLLPVAVAALLCFVTWCIPASVSFSVSRPSPVANPRLWGTCILAGTVIVTLGVAFFRYLLAVPTWGLYRGTVARSLIPILATAVILICLIGRPWLLASERSLLRRDCVISRAGDASTPAGVSQIETNLVQRLVGEMADAKAQLR